MSLEYTVQEVNELLNSDQPPVLLDAREQREWDYVHLEGAHLLTQKMLDEMASWPPETHIVCYCHHGVRSLNAVRYLQQQGFSNIRSMKGGINDWSQRIDPNLPRY